MPGAIPSAGPAVALPPPYVVRGVGRRAATAVALVAVGLTAALALTSASRHPFLVALARTAAVGVPIAVGLHARYRRHDDRFGLLLIALGAGTFVTTFAESSDELVYTVGRVAGWFFEVLLVYVILSFPTGHVLGRVDRALVWAMAVVVAVLYLPRVVLAEHFELPSPFTSCMESCPANALFLFDREPAFVDTVLRPVGSGLLFVILLLVSARLLDRLRVGTPLARRMFAPVFAIAAAMAGVIGTGVLARQIDPAGQTLEAVAWLLALAVPALALAFFVAFVHWRLVAGRALERLAMRLQTMPDRAALRRALAEAFGDPGLEILFPASGTADGWYDCSGRPAELPGPGTATGITQVRRNGSVIAALVYDGALNDQIELLGAGSAIAAMALDINRLETRAEAATLEVQESRARLSASAERERRRIERDLHDGAQQRLVALRIELELAEGLVLRDAQRGVARLQELEGELDEALEEIRSLAHGMYPPLLADRGLAEALRAAASAAGVPVEVELHEIRRYPPELESAVYFCVREALQNVLKHAAGARRVVVSVDGGVPGELRFSVKDDGAGAAGGELQAGTGLTNMDDRLAAVGGELWVRSTPGVGTVVRGRAPVGPTVKPSDAART
jgi:signal transduction histidine kinase